MSDKVPLDTAPPARPAVFPNPQTRDEDEGPKINLGHQEVTRFMDVAEDIYFSTPCEWLPQIPIAKYICSELGYEDVDELEDALGGTFDEFCQSCPNFHSREQPGSNPPILEYRVDRPPCPEEWVNKQHILHVRTRADLWRVLFKAPMATLRIPELEFEVGPNIKRETDTVYQHIANAIFNLGDYVRTQGRSQPSQRVDAITDALIQLNALLDVDEPWTLIVDDPRGYSMFLPNDGVETTTPNPSNRVENANSQETPAATQSGENATAEPPQPEARPDEGNNNPASSNNPDNQPPAAPENSSSNSASPSQ